MEEFKKEGQEELKAEYDRLKAEYDRLKAEYDRLKERHDCLLDLYVKVKAQFDNFRTGVKSLVDMAE